MSDAIENELETFQGMKLELEATARALCAMKNAASEKRAFIEDVCAQIAAGKISATDEVDHPQIAFNRRWCDQLTMARDKLKILDGDIAYEQRRFDSLNRELADSRDALIALNARSQQLQGLEVKLRVGAIEEWMAKTIEELKNVRPR